MARSRAASARAAVANEILRASEIAAHAASRIKWALRHVPDDYRGDIASHRLLDVSGILFNLAQDVASGRVELDLPDEPRPLFDRPKSAIDKIVERVNLREASNPTNPVTVISPEVVEVGDLDEGPIMEAADFPAGTRLLQCSRCNAIRTPEDGHPCPHCSNPEYGLITANGTGTPTEGWPDDEPEKEPRKPKKAKAEAKASSILPDDLDDGPAFICEKCVHARQPHTGHPCPKCRCQEFRLRGITPDELTEYERIYAVLDGTAPIAPSPETTQSDAIPAQSVRPRKPPTKTFRVLYRHDGFDSDPVDLGEIRDRDIVRARFRVASVYRHNSVRLPSGDVVKVDFDKLEVVQLPATPRKKKEVAHG